jgi:hypothetical protein
MSKLSEYSKFDHLDDCSSDEDGEKNTPPVATTATLATAVPVQQQAAQHSQQQSQRPHPPARMRKVEGRSSTTHSSFYFEFNGQVIYEWEQSLSDVTVTIPGPPGLMHASSIVCHIQPTKLQVGLKGSPAFFIDESTYDKVDVSESTWTLEDDDTDTKSPSIKKIVIYLQKAAKGVVWPAVLKGRVGVDITLDPSQLEQVRKELMKERWQEENPGMDFSDAEFNGGVPDPRTFMGGVKYD